jgi:probable DNA metabolism protein
MQVVYDGSLEGFLCIVYEYYYAKLRPNSIKKAHNCGLFDGEIYEIQTDFKRAQKVLNGIKKHFTKNNYHAILSVFSCDSIDFEKTLFEYIIMGFKDKNTLYNLHVKVVRDIQRWQKAYGRELHRWCGFARFKELDNGALYAQFEPKFSLLTPLGKHFSRRLGNHEFILHDSLRSLALLYCDGKMSLQNVHEVCAPPLAEHESEVDSLWRTFFEHVAIKERLNPALQQQFVPLRCQGFMNEFEALHVRADSKIWEDSAFIHKRQGVKPFKKAISFNKGTLEA